MVTKKMDPRVIKTRNNLRRALVSLMQRESLSSISVQKITETAHITRGTFYLHYKDKQDFIQTALQDFIDDLFANVMITPPDRLLPGSFRSSVPLLTLSRMPMCLPSCWASRLANGSMTSCLSACKGK